MNVNEPQVRGVYDRSTWADSQSRHAPPYFRQGEFDLEDPRAVNRMLLAWRMNFWLREIRDQAGLSQDELAYRLETHQSTLSRWENSRNLISLGILSCLSKQVAIPIGLYAELPRRWGTRLIWL
jgi:ribosome-binding protein aMBF1 (putative translation factor)